MQQIYAKRKWGNGEDNFFRAFALNFEILEEQKEANGCDKHGRRLVSAECVEHSFQSHPCFDPGGRDPHQNRKQGKDEIEAQAEGRGYPHLIDGKVCCRKIKNEKPYITIAVFHPRHAGPEADGRP